MRVASAARADRRLLAHNMIAVSTFNCGAKKAKVFTAGARGRDVAVFRRGGRRAAIGHIIATELSTNRLEDGINHHADDRDDNGHHGQVRDDTRRSDKECTTRDEAVSGMFDATDAQQLRCAVDIFPRKVDARTCANKHQDHGKPVRETHDSPRRN